MIKYYFRYFIYHLYANAWGRDVDSEHAWLLLIGYVDCDWYVPLLHVIILKLLIQIQLKFKFAYSPSIQWIAKS